MGRWSDLARTVPAKCDAGADSAIRADSYDGCAACPPIGANGTIGTRSALASRNRPWADELARLAAMACPDEVRADRWEHLRRDAVAFTDRWGATAAALGWDALALFGCSPAFARRLDRDGLLWFLEGRAVVDLSADAAGIGSPSGGRLVYCWQEQSCDAVLPWDAVEMV